MSFESCFLSFFADIEIFFIGHTTWIIMTAFKKGNFINLKLFFFIRQAAN